ncbi:MAG: radical SAM protein [Bacteroidia bacterium]|nr:MAG: radical SAM protein [Bacteroidia bacterium]
MAVFLFEDIIFGPVQSRRLGVSLGVNLLPTTYKYCNFDCIYCECGWTKKSEFTANKFHPKDQVIRKLEEILSKMQNDRQTPDVITFAGNGEPTLHPDFEYIIENTITLRNAYFPQTRIAVLSNATMIERPDVFRALNKVDDNILKLDSPFNEKARLIDRPYKGYSIEKITQKLQKFEGKLKIQTMFLEGKHEGISVDNTSDAEVEAWIELLKKIKPEQVMIYSIARDTPSPDLKKISAEKMEKIAEKVRNAGFDVQVSL